MWIPLGDPAANEIGKHCLAKLSCKWEALLGKHWFPMQIGITVDVLVTNRAVVSLTLSGELHGGFCMFTSFKTNFMQLWFETKGALETSQLTRNVFTNLFLKCR